MLFEDTYFTIKEPSEGLFKDRGSKFLGLAFPVSSEEEIKKHLADLKKLHPGANHHCYAFRLGADKQAYRANDDGEPSNTAGKPILGQIQSKDLTNILIVVVRYFGGTLLGVSGLINAYKLAALDAINNAQITEKTVNDYYSIRFDYVHMNEVMKIIKDQELKIESQNSELTCSITFSVRKSNSTAIYDRMSKIEGLEIKYIKTI
ncbi:MAG: YigZ family protein [Bacteroidetes bacterium]|nr:YigZ family protein [Bacteroidota bacterium]